MLVLKRNPGESIIIADNITITILGRQGNAVRVGIKAPDDVSVHREEVYSEIVREGRTKPGYRKEAK